MKRILLAGLLLVTACGPSDEDRRLQQLIDDPVEANAATDLDLDAAADADADAGDDGFY